MSTSGTYTFGQTTVNLIIEEAFERIGFTNNVVPAEKKQSALNSLNFILNEWAVKNYNLFSLKQYCLQLTQNQSIYTLPTEVLDLQTVSVDTPIRKLNGTAATSAGGTASLAFDADITTACTQTAANGNISYNYGATRTNWPAIQLVGVMSLTTQTYTLAIEYSSDNITWITAQTLPPQSYVAQYTSWTVLSSVPPSQYWRIRETGGGTLNIAELYFSIPSNGSRRMEQYAESDYQQSAAKAVTDPPLNYSFRRNLSQTLLLWPIPNSSNQVLLYTAYNYPQDISSFLEQPDAPQRFLEPLTAELAFRLAMKENEMNPDKLERLRGLAKESFLYSMKEDRNRVPIYREVSFEGIPNPLRWR